MTGVQTITAITSDELRRFDEAFRQAKTERLNEVADGKYPVCVESVTLTRASTGNPVIAWKLRILGMVATNRILWKRRAITEKTVPFIKEELEICGLNLLNLSDLPREGSRMVGAELEATKRTKNGNPDIFFSRLKANAAAAARGEEDLPF
jgi:Protein of unknown function (DUF669)